MTHQPSDRLVIVSNRLPIRQAGAMALSAGGVVNALLPVVQERGGMWLGWSGQTSDDPRVHETHEDGVDLVAIDFTAEAFDGYYHGFSNATLWPLLHSLESRARFSNDGYEQYREVNRRFALHVRARLLPGETVWVHDYQLIPLAEELRRLGWDGPIGYFHHTPMPAPTMWRRVPHAEELACALTEYSHIGVQTEHDAQHLRAILGRHAPAIEVHPVQIDAARVRAMAEDAPCALSEEAIAGRTVLFGVDRLDYTKGIPLRLEAWERVLERRPDLRDSALFVQWAAPSREGVDEYREERTAVEAIAERIERRFGGERSPLQLVIANHSHAETAAALRRADVGVVTSVADGMNLVTKEFAAVHSAEHPGALVLSDGCGAITELSAAVVVDRRSIAAIADGIERALDMPQLEQAGRSYAMREAVDTLSSIEWARTVVGRITAAHGERDERTVPTPVGALVREWIPAVSRLALSRGLQPRIDRWLTRMHRTRMTDRLWRRDASLWPGSPQGITRRLGWLAIDDWLANHLSELRTFALDITNAGYTTAVVLGMGGSSAAARVFARCGDAAPRGLRVLVLDSTVPAEVRDVERQIDPGRTLFVVTSKSGQTIETQAFLDYFWDLHPHAKDFVAITDAGTQLHDIAIRRGFRRLFLNPSDVGGRFSALSYPGLLPAALAGLDLDLLAAQARAMERACHQSDLDANPGARLGAVLAELAVKGSGTLFIETDDRLAGLDEWISQLIAESTGKRGLGLLPVRVDARSASYTRGDTVFVVGEVDGERIADLERTGCVVVRCALTDRHAIAAEFVRWQIGVALACSLIGVNAFDEPDVDAAKRATMDALTAGASRPAGTERTANTQAELAAVPSDEFIAIHAYIQRTPWTERLLRTLQRRISERYRVPVTVEFGPALLHATGQYYKGGPDGGLVIQVMDTGTDLPIPGRRYGFAGLLAAQARGDASAMLAAGRRVTTTTMAELRFAAGRSAPLFSSYARGDLLPYRRGVG